MPLSFLANLGSGIAKLGSAFGRGAVGVGKGIGRGLKRLGELGEEDSSPEPYQTPPFIPREESGRGRSMMEIIAPSDRRLTGGADPYAPRPGMRSLEDAVAAAENDARVDSLIERRNLPIPMPDPPGGPPPLTPAPSLNELRAALPSLPSRPSPPLAAPPSAPMAVPDMVPDMDLDRRNLPIPALPGHSEGPTPYSRVGEARYDKVMSRAKRDAEGNLIPKSEGGGFERDWKTVAQNALLGAGRGMALTGDLGGAIGGALTAGAGSAINPQAGYEFAFDVGERPKLEAEMARAKAEADRQRAERAASLDLALKEAQVSKIPFEMENERAKTDISRRAEERQRLLANSTIALNQARAEAARTGTPQKTDRVNPTTGAIETVLIYPNGSERVVGGSAEAELTKRKEKAAMDRTRVQEGGASARNAATIAGSKERTQMRIEADKDAAGGAGGGSKLRNSPSGKTATMSKLREFYKDKGITDDAEIRRRAKEYGVTVKD